MFSLLILPLDYKVFFTRTFISYNSLLLYFLRLESWILFFGFFSYLIVLRDFLSINLLVFFYHFLTKFWKFFPPILYSYYLYTCQNLYLRGEVVVIMLEYHLLNNIVYSLYSSYFLYNLIFIKSTNLVYITNTILALLLVIDLKVLY